MSLVDITCQIGGEGRDPKDAVVALASQLHGKAGAKLIKRAGGKLTIVVEKNDRVPREGESFPPLPWKATAKIED